jgi:hypothetical protein
MRVLLDENIAQQLRLAFAGFETSTVEYMGFADLDNSELLKQAGALGFDVLIAGGHIAEYEREPRNKKIAVVALSEPHWPKVKAHTGRIVEAVSRATPGSFTRVECDEPD